MLATLVARNPVANVFVASQLELYSSAVPPYSGAVILGCFNNDGELLSACWIGANVVPIEVPAEHCAQYGDWLVASRRSISSIFGPADAVMGIYAAMERHGVTALEVRPKQPLLAIGRRPATPGNLHLSPSRSEDFEAVLPAAVAMFTEEVGYSPFLGGAEPYRRRVASLIRSGHSLSHLGEDGAVIFKADLGAVSADAAQVQGVWLAPEYRGRGLSADYMTAVVHRGLNVAPVVSLYVNEFNHRARASYERVGFEHVGLFATVLF